eukprot:5774658-Pleurochrysis_carterae.AAC.1
MCERACVCEPACVRGEFACVVSVRAWVSVRERARCYSKLWWHVYAHVSRTPKVLITSEERIEISPSGIADISLAARPFHTEIDVAHARRVSKTAARARRMDWRRVVDSAPLHVARTALVERVRAWLVRWSAHAEETVAGRAGAMDQDGRAEQEAAAAATVVAAARADQRVEEGATAEEVAMAEMAAGAEAEMEAAAMVVWMAAMEVRVGTMAATVAAAAAAATTEA